MFASVSATMHILVASQAQVLCSLCGKPWPGLPTLCLSEYEKILLGNKTSVLRTDLGKSLEDFCAIHQKLVVDLLEKTPRISKTMLHAALMTLEGQDASDAKSFAGKVVEIISAARAMSKSFVSGKKTSPAMAAVVKGLLQWSGSPLPVQRTPSRSPRESAASTPVSDLPKKNVCLARPFQCMPGHCFRRCLIHQFSCLLES